jgi:hypothetical protein
VNPGVVTAAWTAFGAFLLALAVRAVVSEREREPVRRPWAAIRALDVTTGLVATVLVVLLCYLFLPVLLS